MIINSREYKEYENIYFIAEIGLNHNGSLEIAKKLIEEAAKNGANAIKFQKRDPEKLWTKEYLDMPYNNNYSFGETYREHKQFLELSNEDYFELKSHAINNDIDFLVSAFDIDNLDFAVNKLEIPAIKIPSPFVSHLPYLNQAAKFRLPIFLSTGMHSLEEIDRAVEILENYNSEYVLMQCTSLYPTYDENVNLRVLFTYKNRYNCKIGYSGHDTGVIIPAIAASFGVIVIEKHFTLDRTMRGPDHASSLEQRGLELTTKYIKSALKSLGKEEKEILKEEWNSRKKYCYSLKAKEKITKGDIFSDENIILKSPRVENAKEYDDVINTRSSKNYKRDEDII